MIGLPPPCANEIEVMANAAATASLAVAIAIHTLENHKTGPLGHCVEHGVGTNRTRGCFRGSKALNTRAGQGQILAAATDHADDKRSRNDRNNEFIH